MWTRRWTQAALVRLGDDQRRRLDQECAHLRREPGAVGAAADHARIGIGKNAKADLGNRLQRAFAGWVEAVIARAQEGEVIVAEPFEECEILGQFLRRNLRRMRPELFIGLAAARQHQAPVAHGDAHLREGGLGALYERELPGFAHHRFQNQHDDADGLAVTLHDRMEHGAQTTARRGDFRDQRIEEERHVVIDGDEQRVVLGIGGIFVARGKKRNFALAFAMLLDAREHEPGERRQSLRRVAVHIVRRGVGIERVEE